MRVKVNLATPLVAVLVMVASTSAAHAQTNSNSAPAAEPPVVSAVSSTER